jgi:hypothetical protein
MIRKWKVALAKAKKEISVAPSPLRSRHLSSRIESKINDKGETYA